MIVIPRLYFDRRMDKTIKQIIDDNEKYHRNIIPED